jgi:hypothetical protein
MSFIKTPSALKVELPPQLPPQFNHPTTPKGAPHATTLKAAPFVPQRGTLRALS